MNKYDVLCIGRQYGSDGRRIAQAVAEKLGIRCYDKELLEEVIKKGNFAKDVLEKFDEKKVNSFMHTLYYQGDDLSSYGKNGSEILFALQRQFILNAAKKEPCIFVGRCADAILKEERDIRTLSVFVAAEYDDRLSRVMKRRNIPERDGAILIKNTDKSRKAYYEYYSGKEWGKPQEYDLCVNSSSWKREELVDMLCSIYS